MLFSSVLSDQTKEQKKVDNGYKDYQCRMKQTMIFFTQNDEAKITVAFNIAMVTDGTHY